MSDVETKECLTMFSDEQMSGQELCGWRHPLSGVHGNFVDRTSQREIGKWCSRASWKGILHFSFSVRGVIHFYNRQLLHSELSVIQFNLKGTPEITTTDKKIWSNIRSIIIAGISIDVYLSLGGFDLLIEVFFICNWDHNRGENRNSSVEFSNILHSIKHHISDYNSFTCSIKS